MTHVVCFGHQQPKPSIFMRVEEIGFKGARLFIPGLDFLQMEL